MRFRFEVAPDDFFALLRRLKWRCWGAYWRGTLRFVSRFLPVIAGAIGLVLYLNPRIKPLIPLAFLMLIIWIAVGFFLPLLLRWLHKVLMREVLQRQPDRRSLGMHELELTETGLIHTGLRGCQTVLWSNLRPPVSNNERVFLFPVTPFYELGWVIPLQKVVEGNPGQLVAELSWRQEQARAVGEPQNHAVPGCQDDTGVLT